MAMGQTSKMIERCKAKDSSKRLRQALTLGIVAMLLVLPIGCSVDKGYILEGCRFEIAPPAETLDVSSSIRFSVIPQHPDCKLIWSVEDTIGGTPSVGMITQQGLFIAPAKVQAPRTVRVCAASANDTIVRCKDLVIVDGTESVRILPTTRKVAIQDSLKLSLSSVGCKPDSVIWSLEKIIGDSIGRISQDGVYFAPKTIRNNVSVMVMANTRGCSNKVGIARIDLILRAFWVQAEDFSDSSGYGIDRTVDCSSGKGVTGLDSCGEWIEIAIDVPATGIYQPSIWYASSYRDTLKLSMTTSGCGEDSSPVGFVLKDGTGASG